MSDELRELAADLGKKAVRDYALVAATVRKGATNIANHLREDAESTGSTRHFAGAISFDVSLGGLEAEIGPDKEKPQGALANLLYFGTSDTAPVLDFDAAPQAEEPKYQAAIEAIAGDL